MPQQIPGYVWDEAKNRYFKVGNGDQRINSQYSNNTVRAQLRQLTPKPKGNVLSRLHLARTGQMPLPKGYRYLMMIQNCEPVCENISVWLLPFETHKLVTWYDESHGFMILVADRDIFDRNKLRRYFSASQLVNGQVIQFDEAPDLVEVEGLWVLVHYGQKLRLLYYASLNSEPILKMNTLPGVHSLLSKTALVEREFDTLRTTNLTEIKSGATKPFPAVDKKLPGLSKPEFPASGRCGHCQCDFLYVFSTEKIVWCCNLKTSKLKKIEVKTVPHEVWLRRLDGAVQVILLFVDGVMTQTIRCDPFVVSQPSWFPLSHGNTRRTVFFLEDLLVVRQLREDFIVIDLDNLVLYYTKIRLHMAPCEFRVLDINGRMLLQGGGDTIQLEDWIDL